MRAQGVDERVVSVEQTASSFVVFVYEGDEDTDHTSWSVTSHLLTQVDLAAVLRWLPDHLPEQSCWALGVVTSPTAPTPATPLEVMWIVGADVLNIPPSQRSPVERAHAEGMLARRHRVTFQ